MIHFFYYINNYKYNYFLFIVREQLLLEQQSTTTQKGIVGKQVSALVNLATKELKGIKSQGIILMAEDKEGRLVFVSPTQKVVNGSEIKQNQVTIYYYQEIKYQNQVLISPIKEINE